jgi:hypothetical protein
LPPPPPPPGFAAAGVAIAKAATPAARNSLVMENLLPNGGKRPVRHTVPSPERMELAL